MGREENIAVFQDTMKIFEQETVAASIGASKQAQQLITESQEIACDKNSRSTKAEVLVSAKRTLEAAAAYQGKKVAVLNFASATNPGGRVENGSSAQEESLCRVSTLYACLTAEELREGFYAPHRAAGNPIHNGDLIYTPNVLVLKSDGTAPEVLPEEERYIVDVITCAAPNLRERTRNYVKVKGKEVFFNDTDLKDEILERTRRILSAAAAHGCDVVILGAFGCGAFRNPPEVVARAMKKAVEEFQFAFETVEFAVHCSPREQKNLEVFKRVMR